MSDAPKLYIAGMGMITPVGANTEMTAAAVKAGISAYRESEYFDKEYNRIKLASIPEEVLEDSLNAALLKGDFTARRARLLQLALIALSNLAESTPKFGAVPLFIAGPHGISDEEKGLDGLFLENLALQSGIDLDMKNSRIISTGRAGSLQAIKLAFRFLENSGYNHVLVGGVDTQYDQCCVDELDKDNRLLCGENEDGFVPGEAAGFLLLSRNKLPHTSPGGYLYEPGTGVEKGHMYSNETYTGDGLSNAFSMALHLAGHKKIENIYSSMNGESFFAKEYGVALIRNKKYFINDLRLEHPADCLGDLGAASGIIYAGIANELAKTGRSSANTLLYCSSDDAYRTAVVMGQS